MIGVDVLAEERDLAGAAGHQPPSLGEDRRRRPALLGTPRVRHDAERAELVAAFLDGEEGRDRRGRSATSGKRSNLLSTGKSVSS